MFQDSDNAKKIILHKMPLWCLILQSSVNLQASGTKAQNNYSRTSNLLNRYTRVIDRVY